jgi:hypothetical protein
MASTSLRWNSVDTNRAVAGALFAVASAFVIGRIIIHEPWRDELQAWLIATGTNWFGLLAVEHEGHPPLWFWILHGLSSLNSDFQVMKIPTAITAVGTLAVLWLVAPLRNIERLLISLSYYVSFEYAVIARGYGIAMFALVLFAAKYERWREFPIAGGALLGVASLSHILFAPVAAALCCQALLDSWREPEARIRALCLGVVAFTLTLLAFVSVWISTPLPMHAGPLTAASSSLQAFAFALADRVAQPFTVGFGHLPRIFDRALDVVVLVLLIATFVRAPLSALLFFPTALFLSLFTIFVYGGAPHHAGVGYLLFVAFFIIKRQNIWRPAAYAVLAIAAFGGVLHYAKTWGLPLGTGVRAAAIIQQRGVADAAWAAFPDYTGVVTFAKLKRPFYAFECACDINYVKWNKRPFRRALLQGDSEAIVRFLNSTNGSAYVLVSLQSEKLLRRLIEPHASIKEIAVTDAAIRPDETFLLWELRVKP